MSLYRLGLILEGIRCSCLLISYLMVGVPPQLPSITISHHVASQEMSFSMTAHSLQANEMRLY